MIVAAMIAAAIVSRAIVAIGVRKAVRRGCSFYCACSGLHSVGHRDTQCEADADAHGDVVHGGTYRDADRCSDGNGAAFLRARRCLPYRPFRSTSGALGFLSARIESSTCDLRSAAFSTRPAATFGSVTVLANLRSVVAWRVRYSLPTTVVVSGLLPADVTLQRGIRSEPGYKWTINVCSLFGFSCLRRFRIPLAAGTNPGHWSFFRMRIREENCNLVLLTGVTLVSAAIAGAATFLEPASPVSKSRAVYAAAASSPSAAAASSAARQPARHVDQTPARVVGAPFVLNTNPRER
jgi:hypothetical protein